MTRMPADSQRKLPQVGIMCRLVCWLKGKVMVRLTRSHGGCWCYLEKLDPMKLLVGAFTGN